MHLENFSLNVSSSSFVNLLHSLPFLVPLWFIIVPSVFQFFLGKLLFSGFLQFILMVVLCVTKITQNTVKRPVSRFVCEESKKIHI